MPDGVKGSRERLLPPLLCGKDSSLTPFLFPRSTIPLPLPAGKLLLLFPICWKRSERPRAGRAQAANAFPSAGLHNPPPSKHSRMMLERRLPSITPQTSNPSWSTFPTIIPRKHRLLRIPHHLQGSKAWTPLFPFSTWTWRDPWRRDKC